MDTKRKLLTIVMDGVGIREDQFGNAFKKAYTPNLNYLMQTGLFTTLKAHGTHVGLPSNDDIGNSEVGHNALGAGKIFDQGAKLVQNAIDSGSLFEGTEWKRIINGCLQDRSTLHFIGLLSDGNVHSHQEHLHAMIKEIAKQSSIPIRLHLLFDGRDVGEKSAEIYNEKLNVLLGEMKKSGIDIKVASGGGRMVITMDRYEADWDMVKRGWQTHVLGEGRMFASADEAISVFREESSLGDQYMPPFVISEDGKATGPIRDGDGVIFFNFRGDRSIEISLAFEEEKFNKFKRGYFPKTRFAGMMEYDGDKKIPKNYLVHPPQIDFTLSQYLADHGLRQYACSETQKFGHVTYFWNGNRSGYVKESLEEYLEIPSDNIPFDLAPWMKAKEITDETIQRMKGQLFDFGRINFPNGDMVGHTGNFAAAVTSVEVMDLMIGRILLACKDHNYGLLITADHGNCDEMFENNTKNKDLLKKDMFAINPFHKPIPKTSHSKSEVPLILYHPIEQKQLSEQYALKPGNLSSVANSINLFLGIEQNNNFAPAALTER